MKKLGYMFISMMFILQDNFAQNEFVIIAGQPKNDKGRCIQQTQDGGYIVGGSTTGFGAENVDFFLLKFSQAGAPEWMKKIGIGWIDSVYSIQQTQDSGYMIIAAYYSATPPAGWEILLSKFSQAWEHMWSRKIGGGASDVCYSFLETADGGYIITGYTRSYGAGSSDIFLLKFSSAGTLEWKRTIGGSGEDKGYLVHQTEDGGYMVVGCTKSFWEYSWNILLSKFSSMGTPCWTRIFGGPGNDYVCSARSTLDGGYIVTGWTDGFGAGEKDILLSKFSPEGMCEWTTIMGGTGTDIGYSVQQTQDGGYIVIGTTNSFGPANYNVILSKFSETGIHEWTRMLGEEGSDVGYSVQQTQDNGYIITGWTDSFTPDTPQVLLSKFSPAGTTCRGNFVLPTVTSVALSMEMPNAIVNYCWNPSIDSLSPTITFHNPMVTIICITEVEESESRFSKSKMKIILNSFRSFAIISGCNDENFFVYDVQGKLTHIYKNKRTGMNLSSGIYFLKLKNKKEKNIIKIVKVK